MKKNIYIFIILSLAISACNVNLNGTQESPTTTTTPESTSTSIPTATQSLPFLYGTPFPTPLYTADFSNSGNIREIVRWGQGSIVASAWSADGTMIAISTPTGIYIYDFPALRKIAYIEMKMAVKFPAFSPDGKMLAFFSDRLEVWNLQSMSLVYESPTGSICLGLKFETTTGNLVGLFRNGNTPLQRVVLNGNSFSVLEDTTFTRLTDANISISSNLRYAVDRVTPSVYYVWDLVENKAVFTSDFPINTYQYIYNNGISDDGRYLLLWEYEYLRIYDTETGRTTTVDSLRHFEMPFDIGGGRFIVQDAFSPQYAILEVQTGKVLSSGKGLKEPFAFDQGHQRIMDGNGNIYGITSQNELTFISQIEDYKKTCCQVSPHAAYLAGWEGNKLQLFLGSDGKLIAESEQNGSNNSDLLVFSPAEDKLVWLNSIDSKIEIFALPSLSLTHSISLDPIKIDKYIRFYYLSISQDGSLIALSAFTGGYLLIYDANEGKLMHHLNGDYITSLFHPSGLIGVWFINNKGSELIAKIDPVSGSTIGTIPGAQIFSLAPDNENLIILAGEKFMVENWENGITQAMSSDEGNAFWGPLNSLSTLLKEEKFLLKGQTTYIPEQRRIYLGGNYQYLFRVFEIYP